MDGWIVRDQMDGWMGRDAKKLGNGKPGNTVMEEGRFSLSTSYRRTSHGPASASDIHRPQCYY